MFTKLLVIFLISFLNFKATYSEELKDVLYDAFNFYPDIQKSKKELEIAKPA